MRFILTTLLATMALGVAVPALAQTPDGETPAVETVCDPLRADGVTKGLYGLCVAYCEAQDHADDGSPISLADAEALLEVRPGGKILANYNRKRDKAENPLDPPMPCITIQEPCPCWTAEELAATGDGLVPNGQAALPDRHNCTEDNNQYIDNVFVQDYWDNWDATQGGSGYGYSYDTAQTLDYHADWGWGGDTDNTCYYQSVNYPSGENVYRFGSVEQGTITQADFEVCQTNLREHRAALIANGSTCNQ